MLRKLGNDGSMHSTKSIRKTVFSEIAHLDRPIGIMETVARFSQDCEVSIIPQKCAQQWADFYFPQLSKEVLYSIHTPMALYGKTYISP